MALADAIAARTARARQELDAAHDYFFDTKNVWKLAARAVGRGRPRTTTNEATGTRTTARQLVSKSDLYVADYLTAATFQQFIAVFESFLFDLLRLWLTAYPQAMSYRKVDFRTVLDAPDKDAVTQHVIDLELNELLYKRPTEWFRTLSERTGLPPVAADAVERFAEAKATRDVLVHAGGVAGETYVRKAGPLARAAAGEPLDLPEDYHRQVWLLLCQLVDDAGDGAAAKAGTAPGAPLPS